MIWRSSLVWVLGATVLAYTPTAPEILSRMGAVLQKGDPVEARIVREDSDGEVIEEALLVVPGRPGSTASLQTVLDLPYTLITLPLEELGDVLSTVVSEDATVALGRLNGEVCYILEGSKERLWISKDELLPLKVEILSDGRLGTAYLYLDMVKLSERVRYPSRTEVWRGGDLILVERLLPSTASSNGP